MLGEFINMVSCNTREGMAITSKDIKDLISSLHPRARVWTTTSAGFIALRNLVLGELNRVNARSADWNSTRMTDVTKNIDERQLEEYIAREIPSLMNTLRNTETEREVDAIIAESISLWVTKDVWRYITRKRLRYDNVLLRPSLGDSRTRGDSPVHLHHDTNKCIMHSKRVEYLKSLNYPR